METSFANGGQISAGHAEPWAKPSVLPKILRWIGREDAPLLFRARLDWAQWMWGLRFVRECLPGRFERNCRALAGLAQYSRDCLRELREKAGLHYDHLSRGILHFATDGYDFEVLARARRSGARARHRTAGEVGARVPRARARAAGVRGPGHRRRLHAGRRVGRCPSLHRGACASRGQARRAVPLRQCDSLDADFARPGDRSPGGRCNVAGRCLRGGARKLQPARARAARCVDPGVSAQRLLDHADARTRARRSRADGEPHRRSAQDRDLASRQPAARRRHRRARGLRHRGEPGALRGDRAASGKPVSGIAQHHELRELGRAAAGDAGQRADRGRHARSPTSSSTPGTAR